MATIVGTPNKDTLAGSNAKDTIVALDDDDVVDGLGGNDFIDAGAGRDTVFGGTGNDTILGGSGVNWIYGGAGNDVVGLGDDARNGPGSGAAGDLIFGDGFNTYFIAGGTVVGQSSVPANQQGDDLLYGTADADTISGDNGDFPFGGSTTGGNDTILAGSGNDILYGEGGNDSLFGEGGADTIWGGEGKDTISGGEGDDVIVGGGGADLIRSDAGNDRIVYNAVSDSSANKFDTVEGFASGPNYAAGDKIDITVIAGPNEIRWVGATPASAVPYSAWYQPVAGGVRLMVDSSGDGAADLQILLQGITSLRHSDVLGLFNSPLLVFGEITNGDDAVLEAAGSVAGDPLAAGNLSIGLDLDGDLIQVANPGIQSGVYGSLLLGADGAWTYTLDDLRPATQALGGGETVVDAFEVVYTDGLAVSNALPIRITIIGADDPAVISGETTGFTLEDKYFGPGAIQIGVPATGDLHSDDVDGANDTFQAVTNGTSTLALGSYTVTSSGMWTYTLDNTNPAVPALREGDAPVDTFTVYAADGTAQVVSVTILGQNDAPSVTAPDAQSVMEDTVLVFSAATGNAITMADEDGDLLSVTLGAPIAVGSPHTLTLAQTGGLTFTHGDGTADDRMSFSGSASNINAALDGMTFTPAPDFSGTGFLFISLYDGVVSILDGITITVEPDGDSPGGGGIPPSPVPVQIFTVSDVFESGSVVASDTESYAAPNGAFSESRILSELLQAGNVTAG